RFFLLQIKSRAQVVPMAELRQDTNSNGVIPGYAHLNPPKTSSALSFADFFLFSARHSKLSTQPVPAQGVTPQWIYSIKRILGSPRLLLTSHPIQASCTSARAIARG